MWIPQCRCQWCELWVISWCARSWMQASKRLTRWSPLEKKCKRPPNMYLHPHHPGQVFSICRACSKWSPPAHTYRSSGYTDLIFPNQDLCKHLQQLLIDWLLKLLQQVMNCWSSCARNWWIVEAPAAAIDVVTRLLRLVWHVQCILLFYEMGACWSLIQL